MLIISKKICKCHLFVVFWGAHRTVSHSAWYTQFPLSCDIKWSSSQISAGHHVLECCHCWDLTCILAWILSWVCCWIMAADPGCQQTFLAKAGTFHWAGMLPKGLPLLNHDIFLKWTIESNITRGSYKLCCQSILSFFFTDTNTIIHSSIQAFKNTMYMPYIKSMWVQTPTKCKVYRKLKIVCLS